MGDHYPHCVLAIEGVHRLYRMVQVTGNGSTLSSDYLDEMILRLNTTSQGHWFRNHFPVVFETNMSQYFNETIYTDMQQSEFNYPTMEFVGIDK